MNYEKLVYVKENIEKMSKYHQQEILEILKKYENVILNENNNGVFINLSNLDSDVIKKLEEYIEYFNTQQEYIDIIEIKKRSIETSFFDDNEILKTNETRNDTRNDTRNNTKNNTRNDKTKAYESMI